MATVTGLTAPRMLEIEANSVVDGVVDANGHLKLTTHGGEVIDAGKVKGDKGEPGAAGPAGPATSPNPEPIAVTGLTVTSNTAFYTTAGQPVSSVVFTWPIPILNVIGDVPAIDGYELWYRLPAVATSTLLASAQTNTATVTTMEPGVTYRVKVRAHSFQGQWGAFSPEINVTPAVPSDSIPQEPGNATIISNVGTFRSDGRAEAIIHFTWDAVTDSTEYAPLGIRTYDIWQTTDGAASPVLQTTETEVYLSFPSGAVVDLKVRAMSNFGIWGDFSDHDVVTAAFPPQNNNPTTIPTLTTNMGVVYSSWNGNLSTGPAGPEFQHLITEIAPVAGGPWTAIGIPAISAGQTAVIPSTPGANVSVRFRWRDKLGRLSSGISPVASITVIGIEQSDFTPDLSDVISNLESAVISVSTEYAVNASESVAPTSGWSTATPARTPGTFVWMRTVTTYADATTSTSSPVLVTGNTGASGGAGTPGAPGKGISSTAVTYQVHTNGTTAPTGTWVASPPATSTGQFLWTRTITTYTDATSTTAYSVSAHGATGTNGSNGAPGVGVSGTVVTYQVHTNGTVAPTGTWLSSPAATAPGQFLWTRTVTTYTDASNTTAYSVAAHGATGSTGSTGPAGKGISATTVTYQVHSNGTTAPTGTWTSTPGATSPGQFLWTRTVIDYTDASQVTVYGVSAHGATGSTGGTGAPGTDATNVVVGNDAVAIPTDPAGATTTTHVITIPFSGWIGNARAAATVVASGLPTGITAGTNTPATTGADGSLILNVASASTLGGTTLGEITLTITCNSKTFVKKFSWSKAPQGATGSTGGTGAAGKGISSTVVDYQASASGTVAPVGTWVSTPPAVTPGQYLWTRTTITYTDASSTTGYSVALQGATGSTGGSGPAGKGISTTVVTYQADASGTVVPSGTWVSSPPATTPGQYLWTRTVITYTDATSTTAYAISKHGDTGATGGTGSAGVPATAIDVGNEAVVIPTTSAGLTVGASTITIPFTGFVGNARAAATVTPTGLPTGITVQTNTAGTSGAAGSLVLAVAAGSNLGGTDFGNITLTIMCNSLTFVQLFSWTKGIAGAAGATGGTGSAGVDATNVVVGNDSVAIPTDPAGATATSYALTIPFSGWIGNARAAATIAASGLPTGITAGTNTPATTGADGSLILNVASGSTLGGTAFGEITLTIVCNSKTFTQKFTWTKAPQGAAGATGGTGAAATSIDVGNDAVIIPTNSAGVPASSSIITVPFTGFIGSARAAATLVVSGLPTGFSVQSNTAGTTGAAGSLVLNVDGGYNIAGGATSGNITLTITVNSIAFVHLLSWSKALAGATGSNGSTGGTGPAGKGVASVTPYYLLTATGAAAPAAPTTNPPGGSWTITEPAYVSSTDLWRAELFVFTDATFGWTVVSKVSAYTAATQAITAANLADAAAHGMVKASVSDPGQSVGRIWLQLNGSGQVIGIKISNGTAWTSYALFADQVIVPSSVGTVSIADGAVNAPKVNAGSIWADEAWLNVLRAGVIEASMVNATFGQELTLESNVAINMIVTSQTAQAIDLNATKTDLETTQSQLGNLATTVGTVGGTANTAMTTADAAQVAADAAQASIAQTQTWFRVDITGAHVGQSGSPFQTHIYPDRFAITDNGTETTTWSSGKMTVNIVEATRQILIGKHQIEPYPNPLVATPTGTIIRSIS